MQERNNPPQTSPTSVNESVSIKSLIASLPPYSFHECSTEEANQWLNGTAIEKIRFRGAICDSVTYGGDGCAGKTRFYFDSMTNKFWAHQFAWEPGSSDQLTEYDVVGGKLFFVSTTSTSKPIPDE
jgi:hypothetical protein